MIILRRLSVILATLAIWAGTALTQVPVEKPTVKADRPTLDFTFCRFDSTTIAVINEDFPKPILDTLIESGLDPRLLPLFITAKDVNFKDPNGIPTHKVVYASDGNTVGAVMIYKRLEDGTYKIAKGIFTAPPAPHVNLRFKDLNNDGNLEVVATGYGGEPVCQALAAIEFKDNIIRTIIGKVAYEQKPEYTFGIGTAVNDTLGQNGCPAIEVWQDDTTNTGYSFVRVIHQWSDSTHQFIPTTIDTFAKLPFWCDSRRVGGKGP
jgi:hypothetical protein